MCARSVNKFELTPILNSINTLDKVYLENVYKEDYVNNITNALKIIATVSPEFKDMVSNQSKIILKAKQSLKITEEMEKVMAIDFANTIYGKLIVDKETEKDAFSRLENEYLEMNGPLKNIIEKLYEAETHMSQADLAKLLDVKSCTITKNMKLMRKYHFVKERRLNERVVYYSLFDEAREFVKKMPKHENSCFVWCDYINRPYSYDDVLEDRHDDYILRDYKLEDTK